MFGFGQLIDILKKDPKKIVFIPEKNCIKNSYKNLKYVCILSLPKLLYSCYYLLILLIHHLRKD